MVMLHSMFFFQTDGCNLKGKFGPNYVPAKPTRRLVLTPPSTERSPRIQAVLNENKYVGAI